jgi:hypothetical protein
VALVGCVAKWEHPITSFSVLHKALIWRQPAPCPATWCRHVPVHVQAFEEQLKGSKSMSIQDYYSDVFVDLGYPRQAVRTVLQTNCHDYQQIVEKLHAHDL